MSHHRVLLRAAIGSHIDWLVLVALLGQLGCGWIPERVSQDDAKLKPMFDAMARVDRRALGFTPISRDADIRLEWARGRSYHAMLHVYGRTSRTVAFRRTDNGYEWIGEQETFKGPNEYKTVDGTFNEAITINHDRVPISGFPINRTVIVYNGEEPELVKLQHLSLETVRPWLKKWGYE